MIKVSEYTNRSNLVKTLNKILPVYVDLDNEIMEVWHVSKNYYRDCKGEKLENGHIIFNGDCWKQRIHTNDIIFENKKEIEKYQKLKMAEKIMTEFNELERKYFKWKKFKEDYPQYFV